MKRETFTHINARTVDEVVAICRRTGRRLGSTRGAPTSFGLLKDEILLDYPEWIINIKTIAGFDYIGKRTAS